MTEPGPATITALGKQHGRAAFSCGIEALDNYLQKQSNQEQKKDIARVFVAEGAQPRVVAGYYKLSSFCIDVGDLPERQRRRLPRYPVVPATLIGRLAVDQSYQGQGLGTLLLMDALNRTVQAADAVTSYAVIVDAKNEAAKAFYETFGFIAFPSRPNRLFLPLATARRALQGD